MLGDVVNNRGLGEEVIGNRLEITPARISETVTQNTDVAIIGDKGGMPGLSSRALGTARVRYLGAASEAEEFPLPPPLLSHVDEFSRPGRGRSGNYR
jgi:hypothetical protein